MPAQNDIAVRVQSEWNGWRTADVRLADIQEVHWLQPSLAPQRLVHGYVLCTAVAPGHIAHECDRASSPHRLLVCVLKKHTIPGAYAELARRADEHRARPPVASAVTAVTGGCRSQRLSG